MTTFSNKCIFMDWSHTSMRHIYYHSQKDEVKCEFCFYSCCTPQEKKTLQKRHYEQKEESPKCQCKHHTNIDTVLNNFGKLVTNFFFGDVSLNQFINMVILSSSFKQIFFDLDNPFNDIAIRTFSHEKYTTNHHFMNAIDKITTMLNQCHELFYYKDMFTDCTKTIQFIMHEEPNSKSLAEISLLKKNIFNVYHKLSFKSNFEELPILKTKDLFNLNPFQRMLYYNYFNAFSSKELFSTDAIDSLLKAIESYKNFDNKSKCFEILSLMYSQIVHLVRFNVFTKAQIEQFLTLNEDLISKFKSEANSESQMKMLYKMIKCNLYLAYYYNDAVIIQYLNREIPFSEISYFHCSNEISPEILKNSIFVFYYSTQKKGKYIKKIRNVFFQILGLVLKYSDYYQVGIEQLRDKRVYLDIVNKNNYNDNNIVKLLNDKCRELEQLYNLYFKFLTSADNFQNQVIKKLEDVCKSMNISFGSGSAASNEEEMKKKLLINKSPFIFTLIKSLKILIKTTKNDKENSSITQNYIDSIFNFLLFYTNNCSDNILLFFSMDIINCFIALPLCNMEQLLNLLSCSFKYLIINNIKLCSLKSLVKLITDMTKRIGEEKKNENLLNSLMRLIVKIGKVKNANKENSTKKLKNLCIILYNKNPILSIFRDYLVSLCRWSFPEDENKILDFDYLFEDKSSDSHNLNNLITQNALFKGYQINTLLKIFKNFLKIVNIAYSDDITPSEGQFLESILNSNHIPRICINFTLPFPLRLEIIKFTAITYGSIPLKFDELERYYKAVIEPGLSPPNDVNYLPITDGILLKFFLCEADDEQFQIKDVNWLLGIELTHFNDIITNCNKQKHFDEYFHNVTSLAIRLFKKHMLKIHKNPYTGYLILYNIFQQYGEFIESQIKLEKKKKFSFDNIPGFKNNNSNISLKEDNEPIQYFDLLILKSEFEERYTPFIKFPDVSYLKEFYTKRAEIYNGDDIKEEKAKYKDKNEYNYLCYELKIKYENDKVNFDKSSLLEVLNEKNHMYQEYYRFLMLKPLLEVINERKQYQHLWFLFRLLQYDTNETQATLLSIYNADKKQQTTLKLNMLCDIFIKNYISLLMSSINPNATSNAKSYEMAYIIIKILKYLCEDHNTKFQTILFKGVKVGFKDNLVSVFELMMCALCQILELSRWKRKTYTGYIINASYYYEIFFGMLELSVEMIQGTDESNLIEIISVIGREYDDSYFYRFLMEAKRIIFNDVNKTELVFNVRMDLLNFIVAFMEEKNTPSKLIDLLLQELIPDSMIQSIVNTLKKLERKISNYKIEDDDSNFIGRPFNRKVYSHFIQLYFTDEDFSKNPEFELSNKMFLYLKLLSVLKKGYNFAQEQKEKDDDSKTKEQDEITWALKFFKKITETVWVQGEEEDPELVIFTLHPTVKYLTETTKYNFYKTVPRENNTMKLVSLIENCDFFVEEIKHNMKVNKGTKLIKYFNQLMYIKWTNYFYLFTVVINLIMLITCKNQKNADGEYIDNLNDVYKIVVVPGSLQLACNVILLLCWLLSRFSLYLNLEVLKYYISHKRNQKESPLTYYEYFKIIVFKILLLKEESSRLVWNIIFSIIGISHPKCLFVFSLQLLIIVYIIEELKAFFQALLDRYLEILLILFFLALVIYIFSTIAFYFLTEEYFTENEGNTENACGTQLYCFLTHLNFGLRTDGGIGDFYTKHYLYDNVGFFIGSFFFQLFFFIINISILLPMLGGSIIDSIAEKDDKFTNDTRDMKQVCFICNAEKGELESKGESFIEHINKVHNLWTYVDYIIGLKYVDPQETNAINSFVIENLQEKKTHWFPSFKGSSNNNS